MCDKTTENYECFFRNIDINIRKYLDINSTYTVNEIHSDFELAIGNGCKKIYPNVKIKFCIWHLLRAVEGKKNSLCRADVLNNDNIYVLYNAIRSLYICDPAYIKIIFNLIKDENDNDNFKNFIAYFEKEYLNKYDILSWNYYNNYRHITNNSCEAYNAKINKWFMKKQTFFKLIYQLQLEENIIVTTYSKRLAGLMGHEYRRKRILEEKLKKLSDDINLVEEMPASTRQQKKLKLLNGSKF